MEQKIVSNLFVATLQEFREGESLNDLSEALSSIVESVRSSGKPGKLTYELTIKPAAIGNAAVVLADRVKVKITEPDRETGIFFSTEDNRLQRDNPAQRMMNFKEVPSTAATNAVQVREVTEPIASAKA